MALEWIAAHAVGLLYWISAMAFVGAAVFIGLAFRTDRVLGLEKKLQLNQTLRDADWEYIKALEEQLSRAERDVGGRPGLRTSQASYAKAGLHVSR